MSNKYEVKSLLDSLNVSLDGICDVQDLTLTNEDNAAAVENDVESWLQDSKIMSSSSSFVSEDDEEADPIDMASLRVKIQRLEHEAKLQSRRLEHAKQRIHGLSLSGNIDFAKVLGDCRKGLLNLSDSTARKFQSNTENLTQDQWIQLCIHAASSDDRAVAKTLERKCVELEVRNKDYSRTISEYRTRSEENLERLRTFENEMESMKEASSKSRDVYESELVAERESRMKIAREWETLKESRTDGDQRIRLLEQDKEFLQSESRSLSLHLKRLERRTSYDISYDEDTNKNDDVLPFTSPTFSTPPTAASSKNQQHVQQQQQQQDEKEKAKSRVDALRMELNSLRDKLDMTRDKELEMLTSHEYEISRLREEIREEKFESLEMMNSLKADKDGLMMMSEQNRTLSGEITSMRAQHTEMELNLKHLKDQKDLCARRHAEAVARRRLLDGDFKTINSNDKNDKGKWLTGCVSCCDMREEINTFRQIERSRKVSDAVSYLSAALKRRDRKIFELCTRLGASRSKERDASRDAKHVREKLAEVLKARRSVLSEVKRAVEQMSQETSSVRRLVSESEVENEKRQSDAKDQLNSLRRELENEKKKVLMLKNQVVDEEEEEEDDEESGNVHHVIGMLGNVIHALEKEEEGDELDESGLEEDEGDVMEEEERKVVPLEDDHDEEEKCSTFKVKTSGIDGSPFPSWYRCLRGT